MEKFLHSTCITILFFALTSCQNASSLLTNPYGTGPQQKTKDSLGLVPRGLDLSNAPKKIAFGSCADQNKPQPIWKQILNEKPDLMIMMGDNIYSSQEQTRNQIEQYKKWTQISDYKQARETIPFMAIWDDHDYGVDNGGVENPRKQEVRKSFWFHWPYIKDSTLLDQPGIFHSKVLGGTKEGKGRRARTSQSVHVIMLDNRWNRSPLKLATQEAVVASPYDGAPNTPPPARKKFEPTDDPQATILGSEQWDWLEDQLKEPADLKILVSSFQVIANDHGFEKWGNFPKEKKKLYDLIAKTKPKNFLILSGDRHLASIAKTEIKGWGTLYDITSSSLNKSKNLEEKDSTYLTDAYGKENFGLMTIDWSKKSVLIEIKDLEDKTIQHLDFKLK